MKELEAKLKSLLHGEFSSLTIAFNDHASNYVDVATAIAEGMLENADWVSEEEKQKAIAENSVWEIRYYPNTPVGFIALAGSSLQSVIDAAITAT